MATDLARTIAEAYRWQRRLGNRQIAATRCHIVFDEAHPDLWDSNHADDVTAQTELEIDSVFADMNQHLGHTPWRVIHTDCFTPDAFLARLALDGFEERPVTIQMALHGELTELGATADLRPVAGDADWDALLDQLDALVIFITYREGDDVLGWSRRYESHHETYGAKPCPGTSQA
jgi:hypothetical protein